jgi:hypothetical protein
VRDLRLDVAATADRALARRASWRGRVSGLLPSLLLVSTQPLKDQFFALAVVAAVACIRLVLVGLTAPGPRVLTRTAIASGSRGSRVT